MTIPRVIIFGIGKTADVVYHQFIKNSEFEVAAFIVDDKYLPDQRSKNGLPVVALKDAVDRFHPQTHLFFVAVGYHNLNADRSTIIETVKSMGYELASCISPDANIDGSLRYGDHCFIMEQTIVQPLVELGDDVWVWSGAIVAHHARIRDHTWIASGATIGGGAEIGSYCFLGMGVVVGHEVNIGSGSLLGGGSMILKDAPEGSVYVEAETPRFRLNAQQFLRMTKLR